MNEYVLTVFYRTGTEVERWGVYGIVDLHTNYFLNDFDNRTEAALEAHTYGVPVIEGGCNSHLVNNFFKDIGQWT